MVIATAVRDWRFFLGRVSGRGTGATFAGVTALLLAASTVTTVLWGSSMAATGMPMPGGWTMSMAWMRMPEQTWPGAAASFIAMWLVMMVAMMLPSLAPTLWHYREALARTGAACPNRLAALAGVAYFLVWSVIGAALFPGAVVLAALEMQRPSLAHAVPAAAGVVVLLAGVLQFSTWKAHRLSCCREAPGSGCALATDAAAWRFGLRFGLHCSGGCAGFTAILLVIGVMDLRAMAAVAAAITGERLAPNGERVARAIGAAAVLSGLYMIARAAGLA